MKRKKHFQFSRRNVRTVESPEMLTCTIVRRKKRNLFECQNTNPSHKIQFPFQISVGLLLEKNSSNT